jgi:hypothetical protein
VLYPWSHSSSFIIQYNAFSALPSSITNSKFIAVVHGDEPKTIMGNAAAGIGELPFAGLAAFGNSFLSKFTAAVAPAHRLRTVNIIGEHNFDV